MASGRGAGEDVVKVVGSKGDAQFKKFCKIGLALYVIYAVFHIFSGLSRGCSLEMTLMVMFPVRELYTIPMIDRGIADAFEHADSVTENPDPGDRAFGHLLGLGIGSVAKQFLSLDICLLANSLSGIFSDVEAPAIDPTAVPTPYIHRNFYPHKYGRLTTGSARLFYGTSEQANEKGTCVNPAVLIVEAEYQHRYRVRCDGVKGYINKQLMRVTDRPTAARLIPTSAWLYILPKTTSKQIAICHQTDIQFVEERHSAFYRVRCDGKLGWVEAKYIELIAR